jgi:hypothetical protein
MLRWLWWGCSYALAGYGSYAGALLLRKICHMKHSAGYMHQQGDPKAAWLALAAPACQDMLTHSSSHNTCTDHADLQLVFASRTAYLIESRIPS